jgi:hypothetical protein
MTDLLQLIEKAAQEDQVSLVRSLMEDAPELNVPVRGIAQSSRDIVAGTCASIWTVDDRIPLHHRGSAVAG